MVILYPNIVYKSSLGLRWINKHIWVKETEKQKSQNKYSNRGVSCYYNDIMLVYLWILFFPSNTGTHLISLTVFFVQNKRQRNNHYITKQFKVNPCNNDKQIRNKLKEKQWSHWSLKWSSGENRWLCFADSGILWEGGPKTYQPINQTEILVITLEYN